MSSWPAFDRFFEALDALFDGHRVELEREVERVAAELKASAAAGPYAESSATQSYSRDGRTTTTTTTTTTSGVVIRTVTQTVTISRVRRS